MNKIKKQIKRLEEEWNDLDMVKDHTIETMQSIKEELKELYALPKQDGGKEK